MTIGTVAVSAARRNRRHTSIPDTPSIIQSRMTASGGDSRASSSASSPSDVASTRYSSRSKWKVSSSTSAASSSTSRMRALVAKVARSDAGDVGALLAVGEVLAGGGEIDHLGDVGGVIADPFEILRNEQEVGGRRDVVRILHHVGEQGTEDAVVEIVDGDVALTHRGGLLRVACCKGVEHRLHHLAGDARHFRQQRQRSDLAVLDGRDPLGDVLGIIADALDDA